MKIFSILKYFIKDIFLDLFHRSHKYKIIARYFIENETDGLHDIEAFVVYKCELSTSAVKPRSLELGI